MGPLLTVTTFNLQTEFFKEGFYKRFNYAEAMPHQLKSVTEKFQYDLLLQHTRTYLNTVFMYTLFQSM